MTSRLGKKYSKRSGSSNAIIPIIIIIVLVIAFAFLVIKFVLPNDNSSQIDIPSKNEQSEVESITDNADTPCGEIVFTDGVGYGLLSVVNKNYKLSGNDGDPNLVILSDEVTNREGVSYKVDARIAEPLAEMLAAAPKLDYAPIIWSTYRTYSYQETLYERAISKYIEEHPNATRSEAIDNVTDSAPPGASEHCTGLAIDIYTWEAHNEFGELSTGFEDYTIAQWLAANSYRYGFILRYPKDKEDITMISFEPWHFRYVGVEAATEMYMRNLTLEEYTGQLGDHYH